MTSAGWRNGWQTPSDRGLVLTGELNAELLLQAYALGIFPMGEARDDPSLYWVDPELRGVLPLNEFHLPRRLARTVRSEPYRITHDTAFRATMKACAAPRPGAQETWINARIRELYGTLHNRGFAHSVECWFEDELVGGLYGVSLGAAFFGESMFSSRRDASKIALVHLVARLKAGGYMLLDVQFITGHLQQFGAQEIPREEYRELLNAAIEQEAGFARMSDGLSGQELAQLSTQTS